MPRLIQSYYLKSRASDASTSHRAASSALLKSYMSNRAVTQFIFHIISINIL
jgi:hypothetical protein